MRDERDGLTLAADLVVAGCLLFAGQRTCPLADLGHTFQSHRE
jgi:hypothetical protein